MVSTPGDANVGLSCGDKYDDAGRSDTVLLLFEKEAPLMLCRLEKSGLKAKLFLLSSAIEPNPLRCSPLVDGEKNCGFRKEDSSLFCGDMSSSKLTELDIGLTNC